MNLDEKVGYASFRSLKHPLGNCPKLLMAFKGLSAKSPLTAESLEYGNKAMGIFERIQRKFYSRVAAPNWTPG